MSEMIQINRPCDVCMGAGRINIIRPRAANDPQGITTSEHQFDEGNLYAVLIKANEEKDKQIAELKAELDAVSDELTIAYMLGAKHEKDKLK